MFEFIYVQSNSGNHFVMGGAVAGGKIHGQYPDDFSDNGSLNIGRGRIIPTIPWEAIWKPVAEWFGVAPEKMTNVLPNMGAFDLSSFKKSDVYK